MRVLIVYESMYGNTRTVAERIGSGFGPGLDVDVASVADASAERVAGADLLVVGGPTHVHGLSWRRTRRAAVEAAAKDPALDALPGADGSGLREWLAHLPPPTTGAAAAFDTRIDAPAAFTGRASRTLGRRLRRRGWALVAPPQSFLVDKKNRLLADQPARAEAWGASLAASVGRDGAETRA
jgi:hypothetical protein